MSSFRVPSSSLAGPGLCSGKAGGWCPPAAPGPGSPPARSAARHPPGDIRMSLLFFQSVGMLLRSLPFPAFPLLNSTPCPSARGDAVPGASSCSCAVGPDSSLDRSHRVPAAPASESPQDPQPGRLPLQLPNGNKPLSLGSGDLGMIWSWVG